MASARRRQRDPGPPRGLLIVVLALTGLVILSRLNVGGVGEVGEATPSGADSGVAIAELPQQPAMEAATPGTRPVVRPVIVAQPRTPTPTLDLMVRLEAQRRISRAGTAVYLDSLLAELDSLLRRWPDRPGQPITVAVVRDSFFTAERVDERPILQAFATWQALRLGLRFSFIEDTAAADVEIRWLERFETDERRTGQTDLELSSDGVIQHARVTLSIHDPERHRLDRNALATAALHEVGHVIGLSHSERLGDIMYPSPNSPRLSDRDRRTAELIYGLPPGTIKTDP